MRIFIPIIIIVTLIMAASVFGQDTEQPTLTGDMGTSHVISATDEIKSLNRWYIAELKHIIEYQQIKINRLEQENLQLFLVLKSKQ